MGVFLDGMYMSWGERGRKMEVIYSIHAKLGGAGTGTIACHAVKGLERQGHLKKVICTSHNNCIDPNKVFMASKILNHAPAIVIRNEAFDLLAGRYIDECDIFHGWNGSCLRQLEKAKRYGAKIATVGASSHPLNQYKLLKKEYEKYFYKPLQTLFMDYATSQSLYAATRYIIIIILLNNWRRTRSQGLVNCWKKSGSAKKN